MNSDKATGEDGIRLKFIKFAYKYIISHLTGLINHCIEN